MNRFDENWRCLIDTICNEQSLLLQNKSTNWLMKKNNVERLHLYRKRKKERRKKTSVVFFLRVLSSYYYRVDAWLPERKRKPMIICWFYAVTKRSTERKRERNIVYRKEREKKSSNRIMESLVQNTVHYAGDMMK